MGIHIIPKLVGDYKQVTEYGDFDYDTQRIDFFDSIRKSGDKDFIFSGDIKWQYLPNADSLYKRPENMDDAIKWVLENIGSESRLIPLLELMRDNKSIWIFISY